MGSCPDTDIDPEKLMKCKPKTKQRVELTDKFAKIDCYKV